MPGRRVGRARTVLGSLAGVGALAVASVGIALVAPSTADAVPNNPANNPTAPAISYEVDCTTGFQTGVAAPFVTTLLGNTTINSAPPTGVKFGFTGTAATTIVGAFIANIYENGLGSGTSQLQWTETIGSTDGHATGSYVFNSKTISEPDGGGTTPGTVTWTKGSTTLTTTGGGFAGIAVGDGIASGQAGINQAATVATVASNNDSITISLPTTAAATTGDGATLSWGATTVFSQAISTGNVFTTKGTAGGTAGIGLVSATQFTAEELVTFGGATGVGPSNCLLTGWTGPPTPVAGPPQTGGSSPTGDTEPVLPAGSTTPLISASPVKVQSAAFVDLNGVATAPSAPTGVSATAGPVGGGYATVSWTPSSDNGAAITSNVITAYQGATAVGTTSVGPVTSGNVVGLQTGVPYTFTVASTNSVGTGAASSPSNAVTLAALPFTSPAGFRLITANGGVFAQGDVQAYGSTASIKLNKPIVGGASTSDGKGYWLVASDGGIFSYGDAAFHGSTGNIALNQPIVGMASTPDGKGYWLVASDGGIFAYGDAAFKGSMGGHPLNQPIVGMASTADGKGYWLVASDGGIFAFGDAHFHGSTGAVHLNKPIVGMASTGDGNGYWMVASDGGIFNFGDAPFDGSLGASHPAAPIVGMAPSSIGGYWLADTGGTVYALGTSYLGSEAGTPLTGQVVAIIS